MTGNRVFATSFIETIHQLRYHIEGADSLSAWIVCSMSLLIVNQCWIFNAWAFSIAFEVSSILFAGLGSFPAANSSLSTVSNIMFVKQDVVNVALRNVLHQRVVQWCIGSQIGRSCRLVHVLTYWWVVLLQTFRLNLHCMVLLPVITLHLLHFYFPFYYI